MRFSGLGFLGLLMLLTLGGCQRKSYTEADVREAIAERQAQTYEQIEQGVRAAPPVEIQSPPASGESLQDGSNQPPAGSDVALPPPNRYDAPRPPAGNTPVQSPPPARGDVRLDPRTGQYGIQPPGAPDTYTIPLERGQGQ
ncbi:MAG: hypothetical protein NZM10_05710 [Fimbriimonadales bacterium]|nr:hypothetical protein [Fimbriimonadales bacterium]